MQASVRGISVREVSHHIFLQHHSINIWISFISNSFLLSTKIANLLYYIGSWNYNLHSFILHQLIFTSPSSIFSPSLDISNHHFPQLHNLHFPIQMTVLKLLLWFVLYLLICIYYSLLSLYHICQTAQVSQSLLPPSKLSLKRPMWIFLPFSSFCLPLLGFALSFVIPQVTFLLTCHSLAVHFSHKASSS